MTKPEIMLQMVENIIAQNVRSPGLGNSPFSTEGWMILRDALRVVVGVKEWLLVQVDDEEDSRSYSPTCRNLTLEWSWGFWRYRVREQFQRTAEFDLVDAGYCIDARDRAK